MKKFIARSKEFVERMDLKDQTTLHYAAAYGQKEVLSVLLQTHCVVDPRDIKEPHP